MKLADEIRISMYIKRKIHANIVLTKVCTGTYKQTYTKTVLEHTLEHSELKEMVSRSVAQDKLPILIK